MNGELGKAPASTAIYTNAMEQATLMAPVLQPATMMQATLVAAPQSIPPAEYSLVNGNIAVATLNESAVAEYYQQQQHQHLVAHSHAQSQVVTSDQTVIGGSGGGGGGPQLTHQQQSAGGAAGSSAGGNDFSENGIPLDQLKQMLTAQLEYYFSR